PSYIDHYSNGHTVIYLDGLPSSGGMFGQGMAVMGVAGRFARGGVGAVARDGGMMAAETTFFGATGGPVPGPSLRRGLMEGRAPSGQVEMPLETGAAPAEARTFQRMSLPVIEADAPAFQRMSLPVIEAPPVEQAGSPAGRVVPDELSLNTPLPRSTARAIF